jgi:hypothetical protein
MSASQNDSRLAQSAGLIGLRIAEFAELRTIAPHANAGRCRLIAA